MPIVKNEADKDKILAACRALHEALQDASVRCKLDDRLDRSPGFKYNDYEMRVRTTAPATQLLRGAWTPELQCTVHMEPASGFWL